MPFQKALLVYSQIRDHRFPPPFLPALYREQWLRFGNGEIFTNPAPTEDRLVKTFRRLLPEIQTIALEHIASLCEAQSILGSYQNNHRTELLENA